MLQPSFNSVWPNAIAAIISERTMTERSFFLMLNLASSCHNIYPPKLEQDILLPLPTQNLGQENQAGFADGTKEKAFLHQSLWAN